MRWLRRGRGAPCPLFHGATAESGAVRSGSGNGPRPGPHLSTASCALFVLLLALAFPAPVVSVASTAAAAVNAVAGGAGGAAHALGVATGATLQAVGAPTSIILGAGAARQGVRVAHAATATSEPRKRARRGDADASASGRKRSATATARNRGRGGANGDAHTEVVRHTRAAIAHALLLLFLPAAADILPPTRTPAHTRARARAVELPHPGSHSPTHHERHHVNERRPHQVQVEQKPPLEKEAPWFARGNVPVHRLVSRAARDRAKTWAAGFEGNAWRVSFFAEGHKKATGGHGMDLGRWEMSAPCILAVEHRNTTWRVAGVFISAVEPGPAPDAGLKEPLMEALIDAASEAGVHTVVDNQEDGPVLMKVRGACPATRLVISLSGR